MTSKIQNPFTKWPRSDEKIKHISKFFKYLERSQSSKIEISTKLQFSKVSHTTDLAVLGSFLALKVQVYLAENEQEVIEYENKSELFWKIF